MSQQVYILSPSSFEIKNRDQGEITHTQLPQQKLKFQNQKTQINKKLLELRAHCKRSQNPFIWTLAL